MRFPEWKEDWISATLDSICSFSKGSVLSKAHLSDDGLPCILYGQLYTTYLSEEIESVLSRTKVSDPSIERSNDGDVIIPCSGETPEDIATARCIRIKGILYGGDLNVLKSRQHDGVFLAFQLNGRRRMDIAKIAVGKTIVHLHASDLKHLRVWFPKSRLEEERIARFLSLINRRIELQNKIIEGFQRQKKILRNAVFSNVRGAERPISELVAYEQPSRYIVSSDDYSADASLTPVLTANKGFILGYTADKEGIYHRGDAVILDDFTLDMKYVDFPFKVKSSAIKILTCNDKFTLRYIYEYLCYLNLNSSEHKRHYISEIAPMKIVLPAAKAIETIACLFEKIDQRVVREQRIQELLVSQKQYLLSAMFI